MVLGIMSAMHEEFESLLREMTDVRKTHFGMRDYHAGKLWQHDAVLVFSRWGKVAAATTATDLIARYNIRELIFTGVAGGVQKGLKVGDVIVAKDLVQHDMDASPIFARHEIPLLGMTKFPADLPISGRLEEAARTFLGEIQTHVASDKLERFSISKPKVLRADIASGDKFFASKDDLEELRQRLTSISCVEMEGAAVAQVCFEHKIPFAVLRTISDAADDSAHIDFQEFVRSIATHYSHGILRRYLN